MTTKWQVTVFPVRASKGLLKKRKKTVGYGWSASGDPEGHAFDGTAYKNQAAAVAAATNTIQAKVGEVYRVVTPL